MGCRPSPGDLLRVPRSGVGARATAEEASSCASIRAPPRWVHTQVVTRRPPRHPRSEGSQDPPRGGARWSCPRWSCMSCCARPRGPMSTSCAKGSAPRPGVDGARGVGPDRGRTRPAQPRAGDPPQRLPAAGLGHPGGHGRAPDPQAAPGQLLPVAARAAPAGRAGPGRGGHAVLCGGGVDPAGR